VSLGPHDHELVQRDVDGETSAEEKTGLRLRLEADPELRDLHQALEGVRRELDGVGLVDPPPGLRADILRSVRQVGAHGRQAREGVFALFFQRPALAFAATLAIGIGAGLLLSSLAGWHPVAVDEAAVVGTIGSRVDLPEVDRAQLEGSGLAASVVARRGDGLVVVDVDVDPPRGAELFVDTAGSGLQPRAFDARDGLPAAGAILEAAGAYVADAAPGRYRVVLEAFSQGSGEIRIRLQTLEGRVEATLHSGAVSAPAGSSITKN